MNEPHPAGSNVVLDVDYKSGAFELVLVNLGDDVAFDVRVEFSRPLHGAGGRIPISELPLWSRLTVLLPGKEIRVFFDTAPNVFRNRHKKKFSAKVTWRGATRQRFEAKYQHDLDAYRDMPEIVTRGDGV